MDDNAETIILLISTDRSVIVTIRAGLLNVNVPPEYGMFLQHLTTTARDFIIPTVYYQVP